MKFLILFLLFELINAAPYWSKLIKKRNNNEYNESETNRCQMQINTETIMTMKRDVSSAYAGNGYSYEIGCSVIDPNLKQGDKYYVIDLIVYGPNTRVAKAWREQFTTTSISQSRSLILTKSLSFHWLGVNNIVCSVSKYNNQINKFTRVCQTNSKINVVEKTSVSSLLSSTLDDKLNQQEIDLFKIASLHRQIWSSSTKTTNNHLKSSKSTEEYSHTTSEEFITFEKNNLNLLRNLNINETQKTNKSELTNSSLINLNLSAKAMQYRDLNEVSDKKLVQNAQMNQSSIKRIIQPLTVVCVFLVVFAITIATLIYSTYHQKAANKQYRAVNVNADTINTKHNELDDDTNVDSIKIIDSKSSQASDSDIHESLNGKSNSRDAFSIDEISSID